MIEGQRTQATLWVHRSYRRWYQRLKREDTGALIEIFDVTCVYL